MKGERIANVSENEQQQERDYGLQCDPIDMMDGMDGGWMAI